jgi:hypothetical protein
MQTPASIVLTNATGLPVAGGGTGAATFTAHGVLVGEATSAVAATAAGTTGQCLTSNGSSADPTFQGCSVNGVPITVQTGTYSFLSTDAYTIVEHNSSSAHTFTLPQAGTTGFEANKWFCTQNKGSGLETIAITTSTTYGNVSLKLGQNSQLECFTSDGTNYSVAMGMPPVDTTLAISATTAKLGVVLVPITAVGSAGLSVPTPLSIASTGAITWTGLTSGGALYASSTTSVASSALLTANALMLGGGAGAAPATDASLTAVAGVLTHGASGTPGSSIYGNATSGTVTLQPVTGALGSVTASLPANTGTIAETNLAQTFTAAETFSGGLISSGLTTESGGVVQEVTNVTSGTTYTALTGDRFICIKQGTPAAMVLTLIASPATGRTYTIKDCAGVAAADNITVTPAAGNIDGGASYVMATNHQAINVVYDGAQWEVY